jgi:hypothetical protein
VRNALALATQLLGPGTEAQGNHAIMKPAGMGAATPWHQDEAYWNPELAYNALSVDTPPGGHPGKRMHAFHPGKPPPGSAAPPLH